MIDIDDCYKLWLLFSLRSYYIARSYASAKKWKETVSLYQRALDNCKKAIGGLKKQTQNGKIKVNIFMQCLIKLLGSKLDTSLSWLVGIDLRKLDTCLSWALIIGFICFVILKIFFIFEYVFTPFFVVVWSARNLCIRRTWTTY